MAENTEALSLIQWQIRESNFDAKGKLIGSRVVVGPPRPEVNYVGFIVQGVGKWNSGATLKRIELSLGLVVMMDINEMECNHSELKKMAPHRPLSTNIFGFECQELQDCYDVKLAGFTTDGYKLVLNSVKDGQESMSETESNLLMGSWLLAMRAGWPKNGEKYQVDQCLQAFIESPLKENTTLSIYRRQTTTEGEGEPTNYHDRIYEEATWPVKSQAKVAELRLEKEALSQQPKYQNVTVDPVQVPSMPEMKTVYGKKYKIAVAGKKGTGKTRLINSYKRQAETQDYGPTELKRVSELTITVDSKSLGKKEKVSLEIIEIPDAGAINRQECRDVHAVIVLYDLTETNSIKGGIRVLQQFKNEMKETKDCHEISALIGTKADKFVKDQFTDFEDYDVYTNKIDTADVGAVNKIFACLALECVERIEADQNALRETFNTTHKTKAVTLEPRPSEKQKEKKVCC